jgi:pre-mRNA-processing factor 17
MFSMPYLARHPSGSFLVGQSMDNSIPVYNCQENVKAMRKRVFRGHNNSGYACQIDFSPNGKYMISGDGFGKLHFWDWKSMALTRKFQAHDSGPCIGAQWHPVHPSWVVTCGWDGFVKLWE